MPENKDKKPTSWADKFAGHIIYDKNGMQVLRAEDKSLPFDVVIKNGVQKIVQSGTDPTTIDFDKLKSLDLGDYNKNVSAVFNPENYKVFGDKGQQFFDEGWKPTPDQPITGQTIYTNDYNNGLNKIVVDGKPTGHIAVIGRPSGLFDIAIRDENNNIKLKVKQGVTQQDVQDYFTNDKSTVSQRTKMIQAGTNPDKADEAGNYTPLQ